VSRLSADGLERFSATAAAHVADDKVPGLVALVAVGDEVHVDVLGSLTVGGPPVRRDSLFRIASTTKPVTAATTLALVGEGLLDLDEPVDRLLPELSSPRVLAAMNGPLDETVPAARPITARQLLTFTFGFGMVAEMFSTPGPWPVVAAANDAELGTLGPPMPSEQPDPDTWIARLGALPLLAQPGECWLYNTGASVLGVLCERAAGEPFPDVMRTRILEPLGMRDTAFCAADPGRLATSYLPGTDGLVVYDPPDGVWSKPQPFADGAAGLVSTADDLLAFARMLLQGGAQVLREDLVAEMTRDQLTADQRASSRGFLFGRSWGFGQSVVTEGPYAGAFGWDGGLGTSLLVDPARDLTVIVLTQRFFDSPQTPPAHVELQAAALAALAS
jgi:CubicO group peptidase (beta-lactamase class C family)